MKLVYDDLLVATGPHKGGICSILITPKEWLLEDIRIDFSTSKIVSSLATIPGTGWLRLQFIPTSYDYEENPKTNRNGQYYEVAVSGINNTITPQMQQVLSSLTYHQLICQVKDKRGNLKVVGDKDIGAKLIFGNRNKDKQTLDISLKLDTENPIPFFFKLIPGGGDDGGGEHPNDPDALADWDDVVIIDWDNAILSTL